MAVGVKERSECLHVLYMDLAHGDGILIRVQCPKLLRTSFVEHHAYHSLGFQQLSADMVGHTGFILPTTCI